MLSKRWMVTATMVLLLIAGNASIAPSFQASDSRLPDAAMRGDREAVRNLLARKVDVNTAQGDGTTALHWAAYRGDAQMVRLLLQAGADVKARTRLGGMTPLFLAAQIGDANVIELLLKAGADVNAASGNGTTPLMLAAASGKSDAIEVMLDRGANPNARDATNGQTPVMFAAAMNRADAITMLARRGAGLKMTTKVANVLRQGGDNNRRDYDEKPIPMGGNTALHFAVRQGHMDAVHALVAAGADVNQVNLADHMPPLTQAIFNAHFDMAKFLLENGADPTVAGDDGLTPLYATIDAQYAQHTMYPPPSVEQEKTGYMDLMKILLARGANPNARLKRRLWFRQGSNSSSPDQGGATAFWRAAQAHDLAAMKVLLAAGADPNIPTTNGCTPLIVAAGLNHSYQGANTVPEARFAVVKFLVEQGRADVNAKDKLGYTALHGAALIGRNDIIRYLVGKGADVTARASQISGTGDGGGTAYPADPGTGDSPADMANGWTMNYPQYPETVALLVSLGSPFSNKCWAATCNNPTVTTGRKKPN